jgi:HEAT repeat protein
MIMRMFTAVLLSAILSAVAFSQPKDKEPAKAKGPEKILDKTINDWIKIAFLDNDASAREGAVVALANFPHAELRKEAPKLIDRIDKEKDPSVQLRLIDLVGSIGIEDQKDVAEAIRVLMLHAGANSGSINRMHCLQAIAQFGSKAHSKVRELTGNSAVMNDPSYEARRVLAQTLGRIGNSESEGPSPHAIKALQILSANPAFPVRLSALESLFMLGPAWQTGAAKPMPGTPPQFDNKAANELMNAIKARIAPVKPGTTPGARETNKQGEMWCRLVVMRFSDQEDELKDQMAGIASHLSDPEPAVRIQALEVLSILRERADSKLDQVMALTTDKEFLVRKTAIAALGPMGDKAAPRLVQFIGDDKLEPELRSIALDALAVQGEKADIGLRAVIAIVRDPANLESPTGVALVQHALTTLAAMGVKAQPAIGDLNSLTVRLTEILEKRKNSEEYKRMLANPAFKKALESLPEADRGKVLDNSHAENQLKQVVIETIKFIQESTPGHPGPDRKK